MNTMKVLSVNKAAEKGIKYPAEEIILNLSGIEGDVHAGTVRQVSIIDKSHIERFIKLTDARDPKFGEFAENITAEGLEGLKIIPFDKFKTGEAVLEVTQIGKPFHDEFREPGNYVMPRVGIFCRVLKPGKIKAGDTAEYIPKTYKASVITLSDRASKGEYEDRSGPAIENMLSDYFTKAGMPHKIVREVIPDDKKQLESLINRAKEIKTDVIITTGGTGIGKRDFTVETVQAMLDKEIPGIMEHIRIKYGSLKPNALLSRGVAGVIDETLIYTLPGSVRAVNEYLTEILKTMEHLFYMLHGIDAH